MSIIINITIHQSGIKIEKVITKCAVTAVGYQLGVARGCTCTPQGDEKFFSGLIYSKNV